MNTSYLHCSLVFHLLDLSEDMLELCELKIAELNYFLASVRVILTFLCSVVMFMSN